MPSNNISKSSTYRRTCQLKGRRRQETLEKPEFYLDWDQNKDKHYTREVLLMRVREGAPKIRALLRNVRSQVSRLFPLPKTSSYLQKASMEGFYRH